MSKDSLTEEALNKLLHWLNPDRDLAGQLYNNAQLKLTRIFNAHGCGDPESLADDTFDRILSKIDWLTENYVGNPMHYICAVARNVIKEDYRVRTAARTLPQPEPIIPDQESERLHDCLDQCLAELSQYARRLLLAYYDKKGKEKIINRKKLAEEQGITLRALRLRVFHLRSQVRTCMEICIQKTASHETL